MTQQAFGIPAFEHQSTVRGFAQGETWDMMTPARPLDINHKVDSEKVDELFLQVLDNPPTLPPENDRNVLEAKVVSSPRQDGNENR